MPYSDYKHSKRSGDSGARKASMAGILSLCDFKGENNEKTYHESSSSRSSGRWCHSGGVFQAQASDIRILPVDTAKFWSGARFDFDVEVSNAKNLQNVDVTINGVPAEKFFGKKAAVKDLGNGVTSFRIDDVTFAKPGKVEVAASAKDSLGVSKAAASYQVVHEVAQKKAKNVILFVGDGMSLQAREVARILSKGMTNGKYNDLLAMEKLAHNAVITTSGYDSSSPTVQTPLPLMQQVTSLSSMPWAFTKTPPKIRSMIRR